MRWCNVLFKGAKPFFNPLSLTRSLTQSLRSIYFLLNWLLTQQFGFAHNFFTYPLFSQFFFLYCRALKTLKTFVCYIADFLSFLSICLFVCQVVNLFFLLICLFLHFYGQLITISCPLNLIWSDSDREKVQIGVFFSPKRPIFLFKAQHVLIQYIISSWVIYISTKILGIP